MVVLMAAMGINIQYSIAGYGIGDIDLSRIEVLAKDEGGNLKDCYMGIFKEDPLENSGKAFRICEEGTTSNNALPCNEYTSGEFLKTPSLLKCMP